MASIEKWEYTSTLVNANMDNAGAKEYIKKRWPAWTGLRKFSPETMIPSLNSMGEDGWELVQIQPLIVGSNADIMVFPAQGVATQWSATYLCVYKRRISD